MQARYLEDSIIKDALKARKIAFISGPRQVGKTTLSQSILEKYKSPENYYTWDDEEFRKVWIKNPKLILENIPAKIIVLDEIHKNSHWKNKLKGLYDLYHKKNLFVVTGSARLDYYRKSGDSLQGRYFPYRLHPFSLCESSGFKPPPQEDWNEQNSSALFTLDELQNFSGFPEPLWSQKLEYAKRWRRLHRERMIREDVRDLEYIREISLLEDLSLLLPSKVGSSLSYESLRGDLHTSADSIKRWINLLGATYFCYSLKPYSQNIKNSLRKEPKLYLYDWSLAENAGARFENLIAGHLLKNVHSWTDLAYGEFELFYLRDKQKREVDFLITKDKKPFLLLEVKSGQTAPTSSLIYFERMLKPKFTIQLVKKKNEEKRKSLEHPHIQVMHYERFLSALN